VPQVVFQGADFAEPLPFPRLGEPADGAGLDLVQARQLSGVDPEEPVAAVPVIYVAFDLLWQAGRSLLRSP
jgi:hypothetical protein